jgi:cytochrome c553
MKKLVSLVALWCVAVATTPVRTAPAAQTPASPAPSPAAATDAAFLTEYCLTCHNTRAKIGGLALDATGLEHVGIDAATWEKAVKKIRTGMMPPAGAKRPPRGQLDAFAASLEARLDKANPPGAHPEAPSLHRLNRTEYANAIRDLLALEVDAKALLPADDASEGFDNLAEALSVSPSLIQGYVAAAMKISRRAVGDRTASPTQVTYSPPQGLAQDRHIEGLPLGTRGGMLITHTFPLDAEYEFTLGGGQGGGAAGANIDVTIDGEPVAVANPRSFRRVVTAGPHTIGLALVDRQRGAGVDDAFSDFRVNAEFRTAGAIANLVINGPFNPTSPGNTPSRERIFVCRPATPAEEVPCARRVLSALARRAYRGSVADADIATLMTFYQQGRKDGDFETGVQQALARILVAPKFVYRSEEEPVGVRAASPYPITDLALASRLSFFLWSSIPDDTLLDLAAKGLLRNPKMLERQLRRMIADPKSAALIQNFAGQWLYLRELATVQTDAKNFDDNLRQAFRRETELLFETIVRDDRPLLHLLDADYTFVDERLARHYGIPHVYGSYFRRVPLDASSSRRGLLGHGSMLTVTSVSTRTSPVVRGKWILENLLGAPVPQPPPGVETNLEADPATGPTTLRQRLERHRANPVCASCHRVMDPMGFALENFDLVGTWRDAEGDLPIDNTGQLADGTPLRGPADLRQAVLSRSDAFMTVATEKLLTYALGRPMEARDMPVVRAIVRRAAKSDNRFSAMLLGVVESAPFRTRLKKVVG